MRVTFVLIGILQVSQSLLALLWKTIRKISQLTCLVLGIKEMWMFFLSFSLSFCIIHQINMLDLKFLLGHYIRNNGHVKLRCKKASCFENLSHEVLTDI